MNEEKFNIELVSLDSINVISAALDNRSGFTTIDHSGLDVSFQYQLIPSVSIRSNKIQVIAEYEIRAARSDSDKLDISSKYSIVFLFSVKNLSELAVLDDTGLISIDEEMFSSLLNITYSTSRGILYSRYLGSVLDGVILPVISTADLFKSPSAIKSIQAKK
jgi:hypothetical protein